MKFSTGRVNAFYSADHEARESIRQDVLEERYADLQMEMENIENLLNISEQERDEILFEINDFLFECLEELVPELVEEEITEAPDDAEAVKQARVQKIKKREKTAIAIAKNAEKLKRAKSNIQTARLRIKGAQSPEAKAKAREGLRGARRHLATTGMKAGTAQK
jgi:hypothetical protein